MNSVLRLLQLAERQGRGAGGTSLPDDVLGGLVETSGASGGILGRGEDVLARQGDLGPGMSRRELPAGRDTFWVEINGGRELAEPVRLTAGVVLGSWTTREELKKARFAERRRLWEMESLRAISEALGGTLDPRRIAEELLLHATALLDARRGEVWLDDRGATAPGRGAAAPASVPGAQPCSMAARIGGGVLSEREVSVLPADGLIEEERLAVPISGRRGRIGVLALAEREVRGGTAPYGPTDAETMALFASQAAVALENAAMHREEAERERLERELELAASIQQQLLPRSFPAIPGIGINARSLPSRHVGGDVYDVVPTPRGAVVMVADVTGKGVPAALMASSLHAAVHVLAEEGRAMGALAQRLHDHLLASTPDNKFATVFLACLQEGGRLEYVSAGHNPAVLAGPDGTVTLLHSTAPPLGLLPGSIYHSAFVDLPVNGLLVLYTDGFTEAPSPSDDDDFGVDRLVEVVRESRGETPEGILDALFAAVGSFTGDAPPHDDRTALVIRRLPS